MEGKGGLTAASNKTRYALSQADVAAVEALREHWMAQAGNKEKWAAFAKDEARRIPRKKINPGDRSHFCLFCAWYEHADLHWWPSAGVSRVR